MPPFPSILPAALALAAALPAAAAQPEQIAIGAAQIARAGIATVPARATLDTGGGAGGANALVLSGTVVAPATALVVGGSAWAGIVQELKAAPLQPVRAGTPLAVLFSPPWLALQGEYVQLAAQARLATEKLARDEGLFKDGIVARVRLDESRAAAQLATLAVEQRVHALRAGGMSTAQIRALPQQRQLSPLLTVRAQSAGTVLDVPVSVGQQLEAGMPVAKIVRDGPLWVELQASRQQLGLLAVGATLQVAQGCSVRVTAISPQLNGANQTATVRAEQRERNACLKVNAFVEARLQPSTAQAGAVAVPAAAIVRRGSANYVFVRNRAGFLAVPVEPGAAAGDHVWVRGALAADAPVAARGVASLKGVWSGLGEPAAAATDSAKGQP